MFIYEDDERSIYSKYMLIPYSEDIRKDIAFSRSNTKFSIVMEEDNFSHGYIILFDYAPLNPTLVDTYRDLCRYILDNNISAEVILVFPTEWYIIKSLPSGTIDSEVRTTCLNFDDYRSTSLYNKDEQTRKYCRTYEKFLKVVLRNAKDCISNGYYFNETCDNCELCNNVGLTDRSIRFNLSRPVYHKTKDADAGLSIEQLRKIATRQFSIVNGLQKKYNSKLFPNILKYDLS